MGSKRNTFNHKYDDSKPLTDIYIVPVEDYFVYDKTWAKNQLNNKDSIDIRFSNNDVNEYKVLTNRIDNPMIDSLYEDLEVIGHTKMMQFPYLEYRNSCEERKHMCVECNPEYCYKECKNCLTEVNIHRRLN